MYKTLLIVVCCGFLFAEGKSVIKRDETCDEPLDCANYMEDFLTGLVYITDFGSSEDVWDYCQYTIDQCTADKRPNCDKRTVYYSARKYGTAFEIVCSHPGRKAMFELGQRSCGGDEEKMSDVIAGIVECTEDFEYVFNPYKDIAYDEGTFDTGDVCPMFSELEQCLETKISQVCGESETLIPLVSEFAADYVDCGDQLQSRDIANIC